MKIAVITGASSGLGRAFAVQVPALYQNLDELWVIARRTERLQQLQKQLSISVRVYSGDLTENTIYEQVATLLKETQAQVRLLVNAAGYGKQGDVDHMDPEEQLGMIDVNCRALTKMTLLFLPYMGRKSRIINVASAAAFAPIPKFSIYAATKAYVYSFSKSLHVELRNRGISVTTVCPGPTDTEFFQQSDPGAPKKSRLPMAKPDAVVRQALLDAVNRKSVSIYGGLMKAAKKAAKFLPENLVVHLMGHWKE